MTQEFYYKGKALRKSPFYVWGIVNLTPDSFYDGGKHVESTSSMLCRSTHLDTLDYKPSKAMSHAKKLMEEGAEILDLGGASSRPNAQDVPAFEEWERIKNLLHALVALREKSTEFLYSPVISVDTWRADVAEKALIAGANIINDISAFSWEEKLLDVVVEHQAGYVLMHCKGTPENMQNAPQYVNIVDEVYAFFEKKMNVLVQKGLPESHIILDLGIGFGKNTEHNLALLQNVEKFQSFKRPLLLGISHKSFFGNLLGVAPEKRLGITQVCTALMAQKGILHHRVHNVIEAVQSLTLQQAL